jgi:penicillin amidase
MSPAVSKRLRLLASALSVLLLLAVLAAAWYYSRLRASLPQLDGQAKVTGLNAAVTVERDALGVPTIRGGSRADVARALGWLHGQERFFQMELLRRLPAGELAEIFGPRAVPQDRKTRMHGFRKLAGTVVSQLDAPQRSIVEAYTEGVNAGLGALGEHPFEYLVLREVPQPWRPEDSILVAYAMTLDLQEEEGAYERTLMTLRDQLGLEGLAFFAPIVGPADAALDGTTAPAAPVPGPKVLNLRTKKVSALPSLAPPAKDSFPFPARDPGMAPGSNAYAVAGTHTATGAAILANDMHLDHGVPNIWYRASLEYGARKITGVTLPGVPLVIAGSNGRVAWGFTNGYVDTGDLVIVELNNIAPTLYRAPGHEELVPIEQRRESIRVKGRAPVVVDYTWTVWGPVVGADEQKKPLVHRWVMHDPVATNLNLLNLEAVTTTAEAVAVAHRAGIPAQNILIADHAGAIAWTIAGRLPKRVGYDGRLPVTWAFGDRRWEGLLPPDEVPTVHGTDTVRPGRIWSGNNRHVGGEALTKLGDGAYRGAARAAQIRDHLARLERATPRDVLAVQLDDRALFLEPWHRLLLATLKPEVVAQKKTRAALRTAAEKWEGRATIEAVSYRLVHEFRAAVHARAFPPIFAGCVEANPAFDWRDLQLEDAFWALWREQPLHLLNPEFASWDDLLTAAADDVIRALEKSGVSPAKATWGARNTVQIRHPFVRSYPWLARWLGMPADPLPGDKHMPRVQSRGHGASERLVVSPGREDEGIFHMPGGQSAHPLSPFFRAGHDAWVRGEPTPFLPGKTVHSLTLQP